MEEVREGLLELLKNRNDEESLEILKEHPELRDNTVVRLALDNRCFQCISFLQENGAITLAGKAERDEARLTEMEEKIKYFHLLLGEVGEEVFLEAENKGRNLGGTGK